MSGHTDCLSITHGGKVEMGGEWRDGGGCVTDFELSVRQRGGNLVMVLSHFIFYTVVFDRD